MKRIYVSTLVSAAAGIAAVGLIAGCSSGSGSGGTAAAGTSSASNAAYSAYVSCLSQHGVKLPSGAAFGGRRSRPAGSGFTPGAGGGAGGGGYGGFASANPTTSAAMQACSSLRPTGAAGSAGGGFGAGSTRLTAFRNCMTQQGEAVPTTRPTAAPTARPTGDARYLGGLNPADPKVAAALKVCAPLIPTASASPSVTSTS
ncbi:hypothetical protein [Actinospica sp.]|jgi:hypothetical protein|uniref:hypothetical protein n=1 Tax=Actinospica sp. TaxID=1872142 RepID=UPI002D023A39|nr:hypothetical protein [Actinospica sp.]HWG24908.1 hypothetical protein [Actinospica sp.]